ncbi:hypothetical protein [Paenibacillus tengchongensis]|uniref:hypothetical protein n=1 Tax=Paenibacillus tengchongensis TaxID=2608684 RepID=UPI001FEAFA43|nr:hypothetical protein [Paenibacillus tengchongensis]
MYSNISNQINQCEQIIQQLVNQTQQASQNYQQLLQQEQQNAARLEELSQREQKAAQIIQTALQGHHTAIQQLQQVTQSLRQIEQSSAAGYSTAGQSFNPVHTPAFTPSFNQQPLHLSQAPVNTAFGSQQQAHIPSSMGQSIGSPMNQGRSFQ